jgi:O-antigen ligase
MLIQRRYREVLLAFPLSLLVGALVKGRNLFSSRGRDYIWTQSYYFFRDHLHWMMGSGLGGFYVIGPALMAKGQTNVFIWLHSDWFQTLFEQGIVGLLLILVMYGHALWRARRVPELFAALTAYAVFGAANMPLRYPICGLFGALLIRWAMEKPISSSSLIPVLPEERNR